MVRSDRIDAVAPAPMNRGTTNKPKRQEPRLCTFPASGGGRQDWLRSRFCQSFHLSLRFHLSRFGAAMDTKTCRHCGQQRTLRARGLCWVCFYTRDVRERYPTNKKFTRTGLGVGPRRGGLPPWPTAALPGTPAKIAVMQYRASLGVDLYHPDDAPLDYWKLRSRAG